MGADRGSLDHRTSQEMKPVASCNHLAAMTAELDAHYATYPRDISPEERELGELNAAHPEWLPCRRKAAIYEVAARRCPVKVFRLYPFYFEMAACPPEAAAAVLHRFMDCGGSVLQLNVVDQDSLLDAQAHLERHHDLVVRVSGYSARFVTLGKATQDEIIQRAVLRS